MPHNAPRSHAAAAAATDVVRGSGAATLTRRHAARRGRVITQHSMAEAEAPAFSLGCLQHTAQGHGVTRYLDTHCQDQVIEEYTLRPLTRPQMITAHLINKIFIVHATATRFGRLPPQTTVPSPSRPSTCTNDTCLRLTPPIHLFAGTFNIFLCVL